jgi:hypothetical protein
MLIGHPMMLIAHPKILIVQPKSPPSRRINLWYPQYSRVSAVR